MARLMKRPMSARRVRIGSTDLPQVPGFTAAKVVRSRGRRSDPTRTQCTYFSRRRVLPVLRRTRSRA